MRARNIKPDFFLDEDLAELPFETRLLFAGLWCCADKSGRLDDRPIRIRAAVFPYDSLDVDTMLQQLHQSGQITRYSIDGAKHIQVNNFTKHQAPHHTERESVIPSCNGGLTVKQRLSNGEVPPVCCSNPPDSLIPDSGLLIPSTKIRGPAQAQPTGSGRFTYPEAFERLWAIQPAQRRKGKGGAFKRWAHVNPSESLLALMCEALTKQAAIHAKSGKEWVFFPLLETWINQSRWDDDAVPDRQAQRNTTPSFIENAL